MTTPTDTVHWREDGTPTSPRFGDIYRSAGTDGTGGLAQARHVFLRGCGLLADDGQPAAWAGADRWRVLETGFGLGLNFLATWQAWRADPQRPARLFYTAVEAFPPSASDLLRSVAPFPALQALADALVAQWHGLLPGVHRLRLDGDRVQLTLAVGDVRAQLAELSGTHDAIFLDGFNPALNPDMWSLPTLKAVARLARRGARAATWCVAAAVRHDLQTCGFTVERVAGAPPKRHALRAVFDPPWQPRRRPEAEAPPQARRPGRCAVVGAGLAGASVAYSLVQRGWQVAVFDRAPAPAAGASGLPAGVVAPHVSPDDRPVSRLTRAGVRATLDRAQALLKEGTDFGVTGVLERHAPGERRLPAGHADGDTSTSGESLPADTPETCAQAAIAGVPLDDDHLALWHRHAGWLRPAALVRAMLGAPGITWHGALTVVSIERVGNAWQLRDAADQPLDQVDLVFVTAGFDSLALLHGHQSNELPLHALRGQVAFGPMPGGADDAALPRFPVNGHGSLVAHVPDPQGPLWVAGSTFERGNTLPELLPADHAFNRQRLAELLPRAGARLDVQWTDGRARAWAAVRATLPDRLPAVGAWQPGVSESEGNQPPGQAGRAHAAIDSEAPETALPIHLLTGLGARGLTLAVLCGEIAAAWLHGEPLPVEQSLARRLRASRWNAPQRSGAGQD